MPSQYRSFLRDVTATAGARTYLTPRNPVLFPYGGGVAATSITADTTVDTTSGKPLNGSILLEQIAQP